MGDGENNKYIDESIINIAFGGEGDKQPEEILAGTPHNQSQESSLVIMNLVNKCLSELDLSKEEMDRIFSSSNI